MAGRADLIPNTLFQTLPGGGVRLTHPKWADFEDWRALRETSQDWLKPWEPSWNPEHLTRAAYKKQLARFKIMIANGEAYPFHVFDVASGALVGACNLTNVRYRVAQTGTLSYWMGADYARRGFGRAAVKAVMRFAFENIGLHRLEAACRPENEASRALLTSVGFTEEGLGRGYLKIDGAWRDHILYAKLSTD